MPKRPKRRMRCCFCGSLQTHKNGHRVISPVSFDRRTTRTIQRYACRRCRRYFCKRNERGKRYSFHFKKELARMHVEERLSYRVIAKRVEERLGKRIRPTRICTMVNEIARLSKSSIEMQRDYHPVWEGYLTVDDKWLRVKGKRVVSLVAVDRSGDSVHSEVHATATQEVYDEFFVYLRDRLGYRPKAITTDLDARLERALRRAFSPAMAHQKCLWHAQEAVKALVDYQPTQRRYKHLAQQVRELQESLASRHQSLYDAKKLLTQKQEDLCHVQELVFEKETLLERFRQMVYSTERTVSERLWNSFRRIYRTRYRQVTRFVKLHWEGLLEHQRDPTIPKTTVYAENINKQFERRLKTIEAFQSPETAFQYQNLYRNYLRLKPYTDCRGQRKARNGSSPLQLCHATITTSDWLKLAIRHP